MTKLLGPSEEIISQSGFSENQFKFRAHEGSQLDQGDWRMRGREGKEAAICENGEPGQGSWPQKSPDPQETEGEGGLSGRASAFPRAGHERASAVQAESGFSPAMERHLSVSTAGPPHYPSPGESTHRLTIHTNNQTSLSGPRLGLCQWLAWSEVTLPFILISMA